MLRSPITPRAPPAFHNMIVRSSEMMAVPSHALGPASEAAQAQKYVERNDGIENAIFIPSSTESMPNYRARSMHRWGVVLQNADKSSWVHKLRSQSET